MGLAAVPWRRVLAASAGPDVVDVSGTDPAAMVAAALAGLGGMQRFVSQGDYVVIKPNAAFANPPEWGTTTHPQTVVAVARACLAAGAKRVLVLEYPQAKGQKCLERCGLAGALDGLADVSVRLLEGKKDFRRVEIPGGVATQEVDVAKAVLSADVLISVAAAKAHTATGVSFGLKNAMGLIYDREAFHTRFDLHQAVADLGRVVRPHLSIVDATRALLTNGPAGPGETATPGRMVAGTASASVDAYSLTLARFNQRQMTPEDARHILLASKAGLGEIDLAKLGISRVQA